MRLIKLLCLCVVIFSVTGGCILDDSDDNNDNKDAITSIQQLTLGGGVFIVRSQGFGFAQIGTFNEQNPYEEASVFVNDIQLANNSGFHSNTEPLTIRQLTAQSTIRIAVYALGDSVVKELTIPEDPVIVKPEEGAVVITGAPLDVQIGFPGEHQYVAVTLVDQNFANGWEIPANKEISFSIPGATITKSGTFPLQAYAVNTSGDIPDNFNLNNQYKLFLVAALTARNIEFTEQVRGFGN